MFDDGLEWVMVGSWYGVYNVGRAMILAAYTAERMRGWTARELFRHVFPDYVLSV